MADTKITALTALTAADPSTDVLPIVDTSDTTMAASGTTKKISINNILGASGTATLASATISGDLTVDTSTLKVTASTDTVTVGATTTDAKFRVVDANYNGLRIGFLPGTANYNLYDATVHEFRTANVTPQQLYTLQASSSVWYDGAGGTRMTLNSTGLGLGVTPSAWAAFKAIDIGTGSSIAGASSTTALGFNNYWNGSNYIYKLTAAAGDYRQTALGHAWYTAPSGTAGTAITFTQAMTLDASGNLGIGVTPSAWFSTWKVLQLAGGSFGGPSDRSFSLQNAIVNASGQFQYVSGSSTPASGYRQFNGAHDWYTAAAGTSPNQITDFATPKMTLESTGSLVLGAAAVATTATDGFLYIPGCAGTPTGTPTAKTGRVPLVVDTTNNKLYFYSGGAWVAAN